MLKVRKQTTEHKKWMTRIEFSITSPLTSLNPQTLKEETRTATVADVYHKSNTGKSKKPPV